MSGRDTAEAGVPASIRVPVNRNASNVVHCVDDLVSVEEPMAIRLAQPNGEAHNLSITMRTPGQDFELALGYLFSEGVIRNPEDVETVSYSDEPSLDKGLQNVVDVKLAADLDFDFTRLYRNAYMSASCGVCGKTSIDAVHVPFNHTSKSKFEIAATVLRELPDKLRSWQDEFHRTGGIHAAATFNEHGEIQRVREDIGRHNAVDKLIGSYFDSSLEQLARHGLLLSGRAGFELVQKAAVANMPFVASIGPPSSLAVELAETHQITLLGFLRGSGYNRYTFLDKQELN